jgi:hypothetical protein
LPATLRVHGRTLHTVRVGPIDAVVERRRTRPAPAQDVLQQQHVIVTALLDRIDALLPARFGTLMSESSLRDAVTSRAPVVLDALSDVRGRRQMTIRVFGEADPATSSDQRAATGTAYLESRRARAQQVPAEVAVIRDAVGALATAERVEPGGRSLRVTIFHLVELANLDEYVRRAQRLDLAPHAVRVSGPWPAFAFVPDLFEG